MCEPQGFTGVLGDRWSGLSGALGASNGSYGPLDVHNCNMGVVKFNMKLPYPGPTATGGVAAL